jgi:pimeloyl-ACP methyl ester carboxylesterase
LYLTAITDLASHWQHLYSGQAYGIFHGDLDFYFGGFDARDRVASIDVKKCPIYFLTGEYDWSTTPEMSQATAKKIQGANFKSMKGLGHFPATEDPQKFVSGNHHSGRLDINQGFEVLYDLPWAY